MGTTETIKPRFSKGEWVSFQYGTEPMIAEIIEVRGPLGVNGRHLYRVRIFDEMNNPDLFELPEDELHLAKLESSEIVQYLKNGALVEILMRNSDGFLPPVWLRHKPRGALTYTFQSPPGLVGGRPVPAHALDDRVRNRIFEPKKDEVLQYLQESFNLTADEAHDVVSSIGI